MSGAEGDPGGGDAGDGGCEKYCEKDIFHSIRDAYVGVMENRVYNNA